MTTSTRELLLGYLLGALEADEHAVVEEALAANPQLREEMAILQRRLEPLESSNATFTPPHDLAQRTCDRIAGLSGARFNSVPHPSPSSNASALSANVSETQPSSKPPAEPVSSQPASAAVHDLPRPLTSEGLAPQGQRWSFSDLVVVSGLCVVLMSMVLPAILSSRAMARREFCANNLRDLGTSLVSYANFASDQRFPAIPLTGKRAFAGIVAPTLSDCEMLPRCESLVCPSDSIIIRRISMDDVENADPMSLQQIQRVALGSMGYNLGVVVNDEYQAPQNRSRSGFVLMCETPQIPGSAKERGKHGGDGLNMLFEDHHVAYVVNGLVPRTEDDPFTNRNGEVEAGVGEDDSVIGCSHVRPMQDLSIKSRVRLDK